MSSFVEEASPGSPPIPADDEERVAALRRLGIVQGEGSERFDRITRLVQHIVGVPMSALTLVDSDVQWFRSKQNLPDGDTIPREISFCAHAINQDDVFLVSDTHQDDRFSENPLVTENPNIRFYAGAPIHAPDGAAIGSLCAVDSQPRDLAPADLEALQDLARMAEEEIAAVALAGTDELTGLANRRGLSTIGSHVLAVARRMDFPAECLFVDVDGMKEVNDSLGHDRGDDLLRDIAELLDETFRDSDVIARLGGDEFCVLLTGAGAAGGDRAVERLRENSDRLNSKPDRDYQVRFSIGRASYPADGLPSLDEMLTKADESMYEDKRARGAGR